MSLKRLILFVVAALVASAGIMVWAALRVDHPLSSLAACLFAGFVVCVALAVSVPHWRSAPSTIEAAATSRRMTRLAALVYAWGAASFFAIYGISNLEWRHWWQYGLGAALLAAGLLTYANRKTADGHWQMPPIGLTALHGGAVAGGLVYLVAGGKLTTAKDDWAANDIFLWGSAAIMLLCLIAAITQLRDAKSRR